MEDKVYRDKIAEDKPVILIGDFNTGSVESKDSAHWYGNLKDQFRRKHLFNCAGSQEWAPTFFAVMVHGLMIIVLRQSLCIQKLFHLV
jgi:hypothetical protein